MTKLKTLKKQFIQPGKPEISALVKRAKGTPLQKKVWLAIAGIPYGSKITYKELAKRIGKPKAIRAVASACGKNPFPILIPCHRVVGSDGSLGGYSLGLRLKKYLLEFEQSHD